MTKDDRCRVCVTLRSVTLILTHTNRPKLCDSLSMPRSNENLIHYSHLKEILSFLTI